MDASLDSNGNQIFACPHEVIMAKMILTWLECQQAGETIMVIPAEHTEIVEEFIRTKFPQSEMQNETEFAKEVMEKILEVKRKEKTSEKEETMVDAAGKSISFPFADPKTSTKH